MFRFNCPNAAACLVHSFELEAADVAKRRIPEDGVAIINGREMPLADFVHAITSEALDRHAIYKGPVPDITARCLGCSVVDAQFSIARHNGCLE